MSSKGIGFIGGGRIVSIFLGGWARNDAMPARVVVHDSDQEVVEKLQRQHPVVEIADLEQVASQDVVFLAVHPPVLANVLPQVAPALTPGAVVVSLAPKLTAAKIAEMLGGFARIARVLPNAPSIVGSGYNPTAFADAVGEQDRKTVRTLLASLGSFVEVAEDHLETYAVVTAMGLTFLWPQLTMLASLARASGFTSEETWHAIEEMLRGAVATLRDSGLTPAAVQDLVPVKPVAEEAESFIKAAQPKLEALLAKLRPR